MAHYVPVNIKPSLLHTLMYDGIYDGQLLSCYMI